MTTAAGHDAELSFGLEGGFNSSPGEAQPFGGNASLNTAEGNNNALRIFEPTTREATEIVEQHFEGSFSAEFILTNPYWIPMVISEGDGSYSGETPVSGTIYAGADGYFDRALTGCVVNSATISVTTQEEIQVTLDGAYAEEDNSAAGSQPMIENRPLQFHDAQFAVGGDTLSLVQDVELSIENNIDLIWELGSRFAVDFSPKQREVSVDYGRIVNDDDDIQRFYGGGSTPSSQITNAADAVFSADDGDNSIEFEVDGLFPDSFSLDGAGDVEADLETNMTEAGQTVSATSSGFGATT